MANEDKKDFNAMLREDKGMPKTQIITDEASIKKYGGNRMYFAPPMDYDAVMKLVPFGQLTTVGEIRALFAAESGADFTEPITAGIFVSIAAWASHQRETDKTPYWRTLKANGELNPKYPGGAEAQKAQLEAEGHTVLAKGRKNIKYVVKDYEKSLAGLPALRKKENGAAGSTVARDLRAIFEKHPGARICVLGTICCGKSTLLKEFPAGVDLDDELWPQLTQEEAAFISQTPWTEEIGATIDRLVYERVTAKPGRPLFTTIIVDCDVVVYLDISDALLMERCEKRGVDFQDAKSVKAAVERDFARCCAEKKTTCYRLKME